MVASSTDRGKDFDDAESMLVPTFRGDQIREVSSTNRPQLDVPEVDAIVEFPFTSLR